MTPPDIVIAAAVCVFQGDVDMNRHLGRDVIRELEAAGYRIVEVADAEVGFAGSVWS